MAFSSSIPRGKCRERVKNLRHDALCSEDEVYLRWRASRLTGWRSKAILPTTIDALFPPKPKRLLITFPDCGGRFYLPYRLHATKEQFERAYPQAREWIELKRKHDPEGLFQNRLFEQYGSQ